MSTLRGLWIESFKVHKGSYKGALGNGIFGRTVW